MVDSNLSESPPFFSEQVSLSSLILPLSLRDQRETYRKYYSCDLEGPILDLYKEVPISRILLLSDGELTRA